MKMKIIRGVKNLKMSGPSAVTIGIFDGVHKGHQKVLRELKRQSRLINGRSLVVTFEPHPLKILRPQQTPRALVSAAHKMRLLEASGVDTALVINFTKNFARITPSKFADEVLKRLNTKILLVGENFVLGKDRLGDVIHLKGIGKRFGFEVWPVKALKSGKKIISSTLIRGLIMAGRLSDAKKLLGRDVAVLGTVVPGAGRGKKIGFPTANIDPHHEAIPPSGVYIVKARVKNRAYSGIVNIGFRPTFHSRGMDAEPVIELHIFNFNKIIYGRDIEIVFLKKIRGEKKFKDKHKLVLRIKKDMALAKKCFGINL